MGIARSTYYDQPTIAVSDTELVETMAEIAETFEAYGYRRMRAALRHRGLVVNHKKIRRLMREHDLQPKARRRFVATTHSDHDLPIFPNLANGMTIDGPNQLWRSAARSTRAWRWQRCGRQSDGGSRRRAVSIIPIADRSTPRDRIVSSLLAMGWSVR
jgi:transposase InsO family protein